MTILDDAAIFWRLERLRNLTNAGAILDVNYYVFARYHRVDGAELHSFRLCEVWTQQRSPNDGARHLELAGKHFFTAMSPEDALSLAEIAHGLEAVTR